MKIKNFLNNACCALLAGSVLLTVMGCPEKDKSTTGSAVTIQEIAQCSDNNNDETACNSSKQKSDGKRCIYVSSKCEVFVQGSGGITGKCADLDGDATKCGMRIDCAINATSKKCEDAVSDCANVKDENACKNTFTSYCVWTAAGACAAKPASTTDIYTWKQVALPAGTPAELTHFVVSGDNDHAYAYTTDAAAAAAPGLYHSADKGATWTRFGGAAVGDGTVRGVVAVGAGNTDWDSTASAPADLKATQRGAVVSTAEGIWLIEGANVTWAIANGVNDTTTAAGGTTTIANFVNQDIKFVDVVSVDGVETIAFGQEDDAATQYQLWLKRTDNGAPVRVTVVTTAGVGLGNAQLWTRAGNTFDGNLLVASVVGNATGPGTGIWEIPSANLPQADGTMPLSIGRVAADAARIFPENGQVWRGDVGTSNLDIKVIGSFAAAPAGHEYYAGMQNQGSDNQKGQLAHFTGPQGGGAHAAMTIFEYTRNTIHRIFNFLGKTRVQTDTGIYGIGTNAMHVKADDFLISAFAVSRNEKMDGTNAAVPFTHVHDELVTNAFGDDDLSWYRIDRVGGADPQAGIYTREKGQGQPRP